MSAVIGDFGFKELHTLRKKDGGFSGILIKNGLMEQINKEELIDKFIYELPILRARIDMTQDEISEIAGLSRQTYSALETRKRKMTWSNFMALLFVFYFNPFTKKAVDMAGLFPEELKSLMKQNHRDSRD